MAHANNSYLSDGQQAYFLLRAGGQDTWYTDGEKALRAYEAQQQLNGVHLFVGRTTDSLRKIR